MMRIKKNDTVIVINGKDKGKRGVVIDILPKKGKVKVKGVAIATRHVKARRRGDTSAIKKEECFIDLSKVMPICPKANKPTRMNVSTSEGGMKIRVSNISKEVF
jgi:large subunit ribosomal protein L24